MHDLRAYMKAVPAVSNQVVSNQLPFLFNIRLMIFGRDLLFFDKGPFKPVDGKSAEYRRGAYMAQSLGRCAARHTAKNFLSGDKGGAFLKGGDLAGDIAGITPGFGCKMSDAQVAAVATYIRNNSGNAVRRSSMAMARCSDCSSRLKKSVSSMGINRSKRTMP